MYSEKQDIFPVLPLLTFLFFVISFIRSFSIDVYADKMATKYMI